jgi:hypothetical protein
MVFTFVRCAHDRYINIHFFEKEFLGGFMKIRYFTVLILTVLLAACLQERPEPLSDQMKHQLGLLPQDAGLLGYINLQQIQHSDVSKAILDSAALCLFHNKEFDEFKSATGFDFQKDASELYFAVALNNEAKAEEEFNGLFVARGNFEPEKIITFIKSKHDSEELTEETYTQFKLYRQADEHLAFCFADQRTLIAGNAAAVKTWLDKSVQSGDLKLAENWQQSIESLKYKNGFWLALNTKNLAGFINRETALPKNFEGIKNIKSASFSMNFSDNLSFDGQGECLDAEKAELFRDALRGLLASAKLSVSSERDLVDIINKVNVDSKNEKVTVRFKLHTAEIEKLKQIKQTVLRPI